MLNVIAWVTLYMVPVLVPTPLSVVFCVVVVSVVFCVLLLSSIENNNTNRSDPATSIPAAAQRNTARFPLVFHNLIGYSIA